MFDRIRSWLVMICLVSALPGCVFGQQSSEQPRKSLTPEQQAFQQQLKDYLAKRQTLQAQAKQVLAAEAAREKAGDCPNASTTYDFNICYARQLKLADASLGSYENIIQELLAGAPQLPGQPAAAMPAPTRSSLTPEQRSAELDHVELLWHQYRVAACTAALHQFDGGTGGPSFQMECEIKLTRDHIRELDMLYGEQLHL